eukprot:gnl/TRDRNA2_/TRDRNA2_44035_c0_seq1.p1 gnl/TRDRNA2_/TRDRNA2_44035_c0~~gnl/TRDRNA2_/TRDRNA2_44035_c0_seq1.p1  ORF type:complete len:526 (-),score=92.88 gnl/TRDRNA2_/TRDRNA2_44035_c0_seq1:99-1646(-)
MGCCALLVVAGALITGLWVQELARFRDASEGVQWVNWIGEFSCGPHVAVERPKNLEELQAAVSKFKVVRAAATGHSFNNFACPPDLGADKSGAVVDMRAFRDVQANVGKREIVAEAGITMGQLQNEILARGLTLRVPPGNSAYTLGGCLATGCHNLGQSHAQDLISIEFILHNGTLREVKRGDADFAAAAVSLGRLGVIYRATLEVLPYRSLQWWSETGPIPSTPEVITRLEDMTKMMDSKESMGNKLVFYPATGVMMMEHWVPDGRSTEHLSEEASEALPPYVNSQVFRLGQGVMSQALAAARVFYFRTMPLWFNAALQAPAEFCFRSLHTSAAFAGLRAVLGWQHSPEARGEGVARPTGLQYTWAGFLDETVNLLMGLRHVEVIFPLYPKEKAGKCLDVVMGHSHLAWWRLNVRTMKSESFLLSSVHAEGKPTPFLRVDFVAPGGLMELDSGEASLVEQLRRDCPGWRKHWGKGLFAKSAEDRWGDPKAFLEVVSRWDPTGKFLSRESPSWLQ